MTVREMVVFLEVAAGANTATGRTAKAVLDAYAKVNVRLGDRVFSVRGSVAKALTLDKARRIASNIAKLRQTLALHPSSRSQVVSYRNGGLPTVIEWQRAKTWRSCAKTWRS